MIGVAGWHFTTWLVDGAIRTESHELLDRTKGVALSLDPAIVATTGAEDPTEQSPEYKAIQNQLIRVQEVSPDVRWYYLMVRRGNEIIFTPDSWPSTSSEHGQSGTPYLQPPAALEAAFTSKESSVTETYTDEYGDWVSAFVPILDSKGQVAAVLGMDIDASDWRGEVSQQLRGGILISVLLWLHWLFYSTTSYIRRSHTEQIEELNGKLKVISQMTRHDVANRLLSINYYADVALKEKGSKKESLDQILTDARGGLDTIKKVGLLETGAVKRKPTEIVQVEKVAREVAAKNPDMEIEVGGVGSVYADEALYSVFDNLVNNARMHSGVKHVVITVKKKKKSVEVRVADTGKGIPHSVRSRLFKLGFVFGKTAHTGIGLYIAEATMERYGGKVWVEDNHPSGCVFVLEFPSVQASS